MGATFAGVRLNRLDGPWAAQIEGLISQSELYAFKRFRFRPSDVLSIGRLQWPSWGSRRFAEGQFLVYEERLNSIRDVVFAAEEGTLTKQILSLDSGEDSTGLVPIDVPMHYYGAVPLIRFDPEARGAWLLTLVDQRFYWYDKANTLFGQDPAPATWEALFAAIGIALGVAIEIETPIAAAYLTPADSFTKNLYSLPTLLDWAASSVGRRVVFALDGSVIIRDGDVAFSKQFTQSRQFLKRAGGEFNNDPLTDIRAQIPDQVDVVVPDATTGVFEGEYHTEPVQFVDVVDQIPGLTGVIPYDGIRTLRASLRLTATNAADVTALAKEMATDFYRWQQQILDVTFNGLVPYEISGLEARVDWQDVDPSYTRVSRGPGIDFYHDTLDHPLPTDPDNPVPEPPIVDPPIIIPPGDTIFVDIIYVNILNVKQFRFEYGDAFHCVQYRWTGTSISGWTFDSAQGTLTNPSNGALQPTDTDDFQAFAGDSVFIHDEDMATLEEAAGVYIVVDEGSAGTPIILKRREDLDQDEEIDPGCTLVAIMSGAVFKNDWYLLIGVDIGIAFVLNFSLQQWDLFHKGGIAPGGGESINHGVYLALPPQDFTPAPGRFSFNNAVPAVINQVVFNVLDAYGIDRENLLLGAAPGYLHIQEHKDDGRYWRYRVISTFINLVDHVVLDLEQPAVFLSDPLPEDGLECWIMADPAANKWVDLDDTIGPLVLRKYPRVLDTGGPLKLEMVERVMAWQNVWAGAGTQYWAYDVVRDGEWTMVANKDTTDRPAPEAGGQVDVPPQADISTVVNEVASFTVTGLQVVLSVAATVEGASVFLANASPDYRYRVYFSDGVSIDLSGEFTAPAAGWFPVATPVGILLPGVVYEFGLVTENQSTSTGFVDTWDYTSSNADAVLFAGDAHDRLNRTYIRFHKTSLTVDRTADLIAVGPGSTITAGLQIWDVLFNDGGAFGDYVEFEIFRNGINPIDTLGLSFTFDTPDAISTDYAQETNYWLANQVPGVTSLGVKSVDDFNLVTDNNGYGVSVNLQQLIFSPDWDLLATSQVAGGGGGSGDVNWRDSGTPIVVASTADFTGAGVTVTDQGGGVVEIAIPGGGVGEANTASSKPGDEGLTLAKVGVDLPFKSLTGGTNITLSSDPNTVTISSAAGTGEANTASNLAGGSGLATAKVGVDLPFKSLIGGNDIALQVGANTITIDFDGFPAHIIEDEGGALPQRVNLDFVGAGVTASTFDASTTRITIPGGGAGGNVYPNHGNWTYSSTTTAPPTVGEIRFNNADTSLATKLFVHETDSNASGRGGILLEWTVGTFVILVREDSEVHWMYVRIDTVDVEAAYLNFGITVIDDSVSAFSNGDGVYLLGDVVAKTTAPSWMFAIIGTEQTSGFTRVVFATEQTSNNITLNPVNGEFTLPFGGVYAVRGRVLAKFDELTPTDQELLYQWTDTEGIPSTYGNVGSARNLIYDDGGAPPLDWWYQPSQTEAVAIIDLSLAVSNLTIFLAITAGVPDELSGTESGADIIEIAGSGAGGGGGGGEANTTSNVGAGEGLALAKVGVDLPFKSLIGGTDIEAIPTSTAVTLNYTGAGGGGGHTIQNEGTPLTQRTNLNFTGRGSVASDSGPSPSTTTVNCDVATFGDVSTVTTGTASLSHATAWIKVANISNVIITIPDSTMLDHLITVVKTTEMPVTIQDDGGAGWSEKLYLIDESLDLHWTGSVWEILRRNFKPLFGHLYDDVNPSVYASSAFTTLRVNAVQFDNSNGAFADPGNFQFVCQRATQHDILASWRATWPSGGLFLGYIYIRIDNVDSGYITMETGANYNVTAQQIKLKIDLSPGQVITAVVYPVGTLSIVPASHGIFGQTPDLQVSEMW